MQFNQITYFLRTCDTLNFTRAAEACHVSQPSLSAAIQKLEDELGGALFVRHGHKISLTALGIAMRIQLSKIEEAKESASRVAAELVHGDTGTIDVGLMCTVSPKSLLSAIALFGDDYPQVELLVHDIWETKAQELLLSGALDCILMAHTVDLPVRFIARSLAQEPMLLAMDKSHPLCTRENISLSDLQDFHYVDRLRCEFRDIFFEELGTRNLHVKTIMRSERDDLVSESVAQGVGVSIMPQSSANSYGLQTRALSDMNIIRNISMVSVKGRVVRPAVQHFIDLISAAYH
jgi:LysR family hydrogen peroxide-inducible transcriptional activator